MHSNYNFGPLLHFKAGNWCAFTLSLQQVHLPLPLFISQNNFKCILSLFLNFFLPFHLYVSFTVFWPCFHHWTTQCVVNVLFLTLLLLCFFGISINSPKVTFLASSLSANISYTCTLMFFFQCITYSHNINKP